MPAKIVPGRNALRSISGRKAGEDHARSQGPLRGEANARVKRARYEERKSRSDAAKSMVGSEAPTQEACQVSRQRFSVLRLERKAGSRVWKERDPVQKHHGMTVYSADACQFRLRRAKRAAWIRNADRCTLGKASQEVIPL